MNENKLDALNAHTIKINLPRQNNLNKQIVSKNAENNRTLNVNNQKQLQRIYPIRPRQQNGGGNNNVVAITLNVDLDPWNGGRFMRHKNIEYKEIVTANSTNRTCTHYAEKSPFDNPWCMQTGSNIKIMPTHQYLIIDSGSFDRNTSSKLISAAKDGIEFTIIQTNIGESKENASGKE